MNVELNQSRGSTEKQPDTIGYVLRVPKNNDENRQLKEGFTEDDNEDIAYLNFRLIWPIGITSALSLGFFVLACASMELLNHLHYERYALNQILFSYGKTFGFCNNTFPYEDGLWPSFLRQAEIKVLTNVFFRIAVCVPMAVRIFVGFLIRNSNRESNVVKANPFLNAFNEFTAIFVVVEVLSLSLFSIVTIRFDYPKFYDVMFGLFIFSACVHMYLRTILSFTPNFIEPLEQFSTVVQLVCSILFTWSSSQVFQTHQSFIQETGCHGYVTPREAITEYIALLSYIAFSSTLLVDIRDVRFICYPRTCSGECEPLRPQNFAPGGKYEHCRAYEFQQRWLNSQDDNESRSDEVSTEKF